MLALGHRLREDIDVANAPHLHLLDALAGDNAGRASLEGGLVRLGQNLRVQGVPANSGGVLVVERGRVHHHGRPAAISHPILLRQDSGDFGIIRGHFVVVQEVI